MHEYITGKQAFVEIREIVDKVTSDFAKEHGAILVYRRQELAIVEITLTKDESMVFRYVPEGADQRNAIICRKGDTFHSVAAPGHTTVFREL